METSENICGNYIVPYSITLLKNETWGTKKKRMSFKNDLLGESASTTAVLCRQWPF